MKKIIIFLCVLLSGCATVEEVNRAIFAIEVAWQREVEEIRRKDGLRYYPVPDEAAFSAMERTLQNLGMLIQSSDAKSGTLIAVSLAPRPLSDEEWQEVESVEQARMTELAVAEIGWAGNLILLKPDAYRLKFGAAVTGSERGSEIGMIARIEVIKPRPYMTNTYPPPHAARLGIKKIWAAFQEELSRRGLSNKPIPETKSKQLKGTDA